MKRFGQILKVLLLGLLGAFMMNDIGTRCYERGERFLGIIACVFGLFFALFSILTLVVIGEWKWKRSRARDPERIRRSIELLTSTLSSGFRYFHVGEKGADRIEAGLATLIRKQGPAKWYLYLECEPDPGYEPVPGTPFYWGLPTLWKDESHDPMRREITEKEAFILIRRAAPYGG